MKDFPSVPDDMICPAEDVFNFASITQGLSDLEQQHRGDTAALRKAVVPLLREERKRGRAVLEEMLASHPFAAQSIIRGISWQTDCILLTVLDIATRLLHPSSGPSASDRLTVCAVGGYGRGEMAPESDIDLMFLTPNRITPQAEKVIETMLYMLWDMRLKVGHASRTIADCLRLGREDFTIRTALLENRFLAGDPALFEALNTTLWNKLFKGTEREFIEAKLSEREERHRKPGNQRYMVEPNVKEGKGGLRDLQSLFWIAKYIYRVGDITELVRKGVFAEEEYDTFAKAHNFLWAVRCHLHLITRRPNDQLSFDLQVEVAARMGYIDISGRRAVELFMQDYFRHATAVGDLTRIFLTKLEAMHVKPDALLQRLFRRKKTLKDDYEEVHGRLAIKNKKTFLKDRLNLLRLFEEGLRTGMLIHPDAMRHVTANLHLIDDGFRNDPEAQKLFLGLLLKHGNPERALRRMNELGVLSTFIPEFEPIVAMMQFNMYHHYTVDEHTIQCISHLAQIERKRTGRGIACRLFHPAGRGEPQGALRGVAACTTSPRDATEDHSILGAQIARKVAAAPWAETQGGGHGGMAGALSPADVGHGAEA